jgi:predicted DNA-binding transcriptional regulator AlpA
MCLNDKSLSQLIPRLIRLRDAPFYLGMDRNRFNAEVRPYLTQIPIGEQGIAFDRLELDAWVEQYKSRNGRPASNSRGVASWDAKEFQGLGIVAGSGTSKSRPSAKKFTKALEQAISKKRN